MRRTLRMAIVIGLLVTGTGVACADEFVVVAASGETGLRPGASISGNEMLTLATGSRITLLSRSGALQVIDGPFSGVPAETGPVAEGALPEGKWNTLKTLIGDPDARSDVMGASRNLDTAYALPPRIWTVNVDSSGPRCSPQSGIVLSRRAAEKQVEVSARSSQSRATDLIWQQGETELSLPPGFAVEDGRLVVSLDGKVREIELKVRPDRLEGAAPGALLTWLLDQKCNRQALTLIERVQSNATID